MLTAPEDSGTDTILVPVVKVFDGDGFLTRIDDTRSGISLEVTVRFGFTDAPEMKQAGGRQARDFLCSLIGGKWIDLVILTKMDTGGIIDRYGRIVAVPYLRTHSAAPSACGSIMRAVVRHLQSPAFRNIELEMVLNGWAWVLDRYGPDEGYLQALDDARRHRRGIWAFEHNVHPWDFKRQRYVRRSAPNSTQANLFAQPTERVSCPVDGCSGQLVEKDGRHGKFVGCSNFPSCRYSQNLGHSGW